MHDCNTFFFKIQNLNKKKKLNTLTKARRQVDYYAHLRMPTYLVHMPFESKYGLLREHIIESLKMVEYSMGMA